MGVVRNVVVKLGADLSNFSSKMNKASSIAQNTAKKIGNVGKKMTTGATLPIVGVGAASVKVAADFEQSMSKVRAIMGATGKESGQNFEKMRKKALEMGASTTKTASEAASAMEYMGLAGWDTTQIMEGIEPVLKLSEAGALDLGRASDLVTDSMSAFGIETKDLNGYLDKVAKASTKSNSSIDGFMEALIGAGGQLKGLNIGMTEATGLLGIMANRGIKGSEAGTKLSSILVNLTTGAGQAGDALGELNFSAYDSKGKFKGMGRVLEELNGKLNKQTDAEKQRLKAMIGGKTQIDTLNALLDGQSKEYSQLTKDIDNSSGALKTMSEVMTDNVHGGISKLKSAIEGLMINIGDKLLPVISKITDKLIKFTEKISNLSPKTLGLIMTIAGIVAAIGPALLAISGMVSGFGALSGAASTVAAVLGKVFAGGLLATVGSTAIIVTSLVLAFLALSAAVIKIKFGNFKNFVEYLKKLKAVKNISKLFQSVKKSIMEFVDIAVVQFIKFKDMFVKAIQNIDFTNLKNSFTKITSTFLRFFEVIKPIYKILGIMVVGAIGLVVAAIPALIQFISNVISTAVELGSIFTNVMSVIVGLFTLDFATVKDSLFAIWDSIVNIFKSNTLGLVSVVYNFINTIIGFFTGNFKVLPTSIDEIWNNIKRNTTAVFDWLRAFFIGVWEGIKSIVLRSINWISLFIDDSLEAIKYIFTTIFNVIKSFLSMVFNGYLNIVISIFTEIKTFISNSLTFIKTLFITGFNAYKKIITDIAEGALTWGKNLIDNFIKGVTGKFGDLKKVAENVGTIITDFIGIFSPSKKGPLKTSDKWGGNLIKMYGKSMTKKSSYVKNAVNHLTKYLSKLQIKGIIFDINKLKNKDEIKPYFEKLGDNIIRELENIQSKAKSIMNFTDIFGKFDNKVVSGTKLFSNLTNQVKVMKDYKNVMEVMAGKLGSRSVLYQKLQSMGIGSLNEIKALNRLSNSKLLEYLNLYNDKSSIAQDLAKDQYNSDILSNKEFSNIIMNITGNKISNEDDVTEITDMIVKNLKLQGVF